MLPNDDDIHQAYSREQKQYRLSRQESRKQHLRRAKLNMVFRCMWEGAVDIKGQAGAGAGAWTTAYLAVQEHRLIWWQKEEDIDDGKAPVGQLLLFGHAGTTQPSPVDVREIGSDTRLATIFGRDPNGQSCSRTFHAVLLKRHYSSFILEQ